MNHNQSVFCRWMQFRLITALGFAAILFAAVVPGVQAAEKTYDVANASFETAGDNGVPQSWNGDRNVYSFDGAVSHTGSASMKWVNDDSNRYRLCYQYVDVKPGEAAVFSVWVKTKDLKGGKAAICMEWSDAQTGKWLGGAYARGVAGTSDWTRISTYAEVPLEAKEGSVHVTCYCTQGATGTAWFDDVEIKSYIPPFFSAMTTNRYRHMTVGGEVKAFVGINNRFYKIDLAKSPGQLVVSGANLKENLVLAPSQVGSDYVEFTIDSDALPVGEYQLEYQTVNPISEKPETISKTLTKFEQFPTYKTRIDEHRRFIVDGKPFFPLGMYFGGIKPEELDIYADSKFNCLMPYHTLTRESLDLLQQKNIRCIYSVKDFYVGLRSNSDEQGIQMAAQKINEFKDHPAIIAWYINDELPLSMLEPLTKHRDLCEELDPGRPTWVVLYQYKQIRSYIPTFDVIGTDPYPIPSQPASNAYLYAKSTYDGSFGAHAMIQVPQAFNWASYRKKTEDKQKNRTPTYEELRGMAWMNIAGGANGLIFYSWFDLWKMDKTVEEGGTALVREPFEQRWAELKKLGEEIADCFPILLGDEPTLNVTKSDESDDEVVSRLFGANGSTWLLIVNTNDKETKTAVYEIPGAATLGQTKLGSPAAQDGNNIRIVLPPLEPRLIEIK